MQSADKKCVTLDDLLEKFDLSDLRENGKLNALYRKAINSLMAFAGNVHECRLEDLDKLLYGWIVSLRVRDFALKTVSDYLMSISGIYSRAQKRGFVPATDVFSAIRAKFKEGGNEQWITGVHISDFERFGKLVRAELVNKESNDTGADIMLLSLLNGCSPIVEVAKWKKNEIPADIHAPAVVSRASSRSGREYLFPLKHGKRTPNQFAADVNELVISFLNKHNIKTFGDADATLASYWGFAALWSGVSPASVLSVLGFIPEGLTFLSLTAETLADEQCVTDVRQVVNSMFVGAPMRWYAMHLRPRVTFDDLVKRIGAEKGLAMPEIFYPSQEMTRHIGKKVVFEEQPFIHNVVFFKSRYEEISPMFNRIGDVAWCYKTGIGPESTYAPIQQKSFDDFQKAIGCFTPEFLAEHQTAEILAKGDTVRILGGNCCSQVGTIKDIEQSGPEGILTYLIELCGSIAGPITAHVDSRQVEKIPVT